MPESEADAADLEKNRQELVAAQSRIAELERLLAQTQSSPIAQPSLDRYQRTLDSLLESCQIISFDWRYLYLNDAAAAQGQIPKADLLGHTVMEMVPGIESTPMFAAMRKCMEERTSQHEVFDFTFPDDRKSAFEFRIQPVPEGIFILATNIGERQRADENLRRLNRTLSVLSDINQTIVRTRDIPTLLQKACDIAVQQGAFQMAWIGLIDPQANGMNLLVHAGASDDYVDKLKAVINEGQQKQGLVTLALSTGKRAVSNDIDTDPLMSRWREMTLQLGYRATVALPLTVETDVRGVFQLYAKEINFFDEKELKLVDEMAMDISFAMTFAEQEQHRQQAQEAVKRYTQRMEVFHEIDTGLLQGESIEALIHITLVHLKSLIPCQQANVILIDRTVGATGEGLIYAIDHNHQSAFAEGSRFPLPPDAFDGYDERHVKVFDDIRLEPESNARAKRLASEGLISGMSVFLMDHDEPIASLSLLADKSGFFTPEYQEIGIEIAHQLAIAIRQIKLSDELELRVLDRTAKLNQAMHRVEAILNSSTDGVVLAYLGKGIQQTNNTFNSLFSSQMDDYFGQPLTVLVSEADQEPLKNLIQAAVSEQRGKTIEVRARRHDNTFFDAEIGISMMVGLGKDEEGFVCNVRDISQRKQLTKELDEQRTFLREVIDVSPSMIFVKDYNANFVLVNPMVAKMYHTTVEDLIGKSDADFNPSAQEVADFLEADRQVIATGETLIVEEPVTNAEGDTHSFETIKVPIVSVDGKSKYVLGVSSDVTERRKSEEVLREAYKKEKELGELKSRFVSMASHEFRTPLATILAVTETLLAYRHKMDDTQIDLRLGKMQDQIEHLKNVIDDVLQLAQIQARRVVFNPVRVDLDAMCRSVLDEFQSRPNIKHELVYTCDVRLKDSYLDKRLMRQIISNLMSNAVKYSPDGKTIKISLEEKDNNLIFKIQDQGIGIPEADLKHLFEPFHRADNVGSISGTGLGLVITKESVELHGGTITVESQVNVGTAFTVTIPIVTTSQPRY